MDQLTHLVQTLTALLVMVLPVIGVTGGLKQLIDGAPDFNLGPFVIKGGVWLSWLCAAVLIGVGHAAGWLPAPSGDVQTWIAAEWATLAMLANVVYSTAYGGKPAPA